MTTPHRRRSGAVVALAVGVFVVAACSSSDSTATAPAVSVASTSTDAPEASSAPSASEPSTTMAASTGAVPPSTDVEQTVDTRPIDEPSRELATAMTLQTADFDEPWTVFTEAGPFIVTPAVCSYRPDGAMTRLPNGAAQRGPMLQMGTDPAFVSSSALAFPDETSAQEYVDVVNSDEWAECVRKGIDDGQVALGETDVEVAVADRTVDGLGEAGLEGYLRLTLSNEEGVFDQVIYQTYRIGRVVGLVTLEIGAVGDAAATVFDDGYYNALLKAYDRVDAVGAE